VKSYLWRIKRIFSKYVNLLTNQNHRNRNNFITFSQQNFLWCKSTNGSNFGTSIIVRDIVVVWNHDISISSIGESVTIGFVKMASSCRVSCGVVGKIRHQCRAGLGGWPTSFQGCTSRVSGIPIYWISINSVPKKGVRWSSCSSSNTRSRNLRINTFEN